MAFNSDLYIDPRDYNGGNAADPDTLKLAILGALDEDLPLCIFDVLYVHGPMTRFDALPHYELPTGQSLIIRGVRGGGIKRQDNSIPGVGHTDTNMIRILPEAAPPSGLSDDPDFVDVVRFTTGSVKIQNVFFDLNWLGQTDAIAAIRAGTITKNTIEQDHAFYIQAEGFAGTGEYAGKDVHPIYRSIEWNGCHVVDRWHTDLYKTQGQSGVRSNICAHAVRFDNMTEDYSWITDEDLVTGVRARAMITLYNKVPLVISTRCDVSRFEEEATVAYAESVGNDGYANEVWVEDLVAPELDLLPIFHDTLYRLSRVTSERLQLNRMAGWARDCTFGLPVSASGPFTIGNNPETDIDLGGFTFYDCTFNMTRNRQIPLKSNALDPADAWETEIHYEGCTFIETGPGFGVDVALFYTESGITGTGKTITSSWVACAWQDVTLPHIYLQWPGTFVIDCNGLPDASIILNYGSAALPATVTLLNYREGFPEVSILAGAGLTILDSEGAQIYPPVASGQIVDQAGTTITDQAGTDIDI